MIRHVLAIIATGLSMTFIAGAQAAPCPTGTVSVNLTSSEDVQSQLTGMMNCTGQGVFSVTWHGKLQVTGSIVVSDEKSLKITGVNGSALYEFSRDDDAFGQEAPGGMFVVSNGSILAINDMILDGTVLQGRTAVTVTSSSSLYVVDCDFLNHRRPTEGGAISASQSYIHIGGASSFSGNHAEFGGSIYAEHSEVYIDGSPYFGNNDAKFGGAIYAYDSELNINGSARFALSSANHSGGAISANRSEIYIDGDTEFQANSAGVGGAVSTFDSEFVMNGNTSFLSNEAITSGGGILSDGGNVSFPSGGSTIFSSNVAGGDGGAMSIITPYEVHITRVAFLSNTADRGGAMYMASPGYDTGRAYQNCVFSGNRATIGGALYLNAQSGTDTVVDCVFDSNFADSSGGAIYADGSLNLFSSDFAGNRAGEAGVAIASGCSSSNVELEDVRFTRNGLYCPPGLYDPFNYDDEDDISDFDVGDFAAFAMLCKGCSAAAHTVPDRVSVQQTMPVCDEPPAGTTARSYGTQIGTLALNRGFYRDSAWSENILVCYRAEACAGGDSAGNYCAVGYEGAYCSACSNGFSPGTDYSCRECSYYDTRHAAQIAAVVIVCILIGAAGIYKYLGRRGDEEEMEGLAAPRRCARQKCTYFRDSLMKALPLTAIKILVVVWQIVFQLSAVVEDVYPKEYQEFLSIISFVNVDINAIVSYSCLVSPNFYGRLVLATTAPLVVLAMLAVAYNTAKRKSHISSQIRLTVRSRYISAALLVTFFVYSSVSSAIFQTFLCEQVGENRYLRADYSLSCVGTLHNTYVIYASMMAGVYPIGIPALFCWWLVRNREHLKKTDRQAIAHLQPFSGIWGTYRPSRYYYEVVEYCRRLALSMASVFLIPNSVDHIAVVLSLAVVFMFISESLSPFESSLDMSLYRWGNGIVLASMYVALLMKAKESNSEFRALSVYGWVLISANVLMVAAVVVEAACLGRNWRGLESRVDQVTPPVRSVISTRLGGRPPASPVAASGEGIAEGKDCVSPRRENGVRPHAHPDSP